MIIAPVEFSPVIEASAIQAAFARLAKAGANSVLMLAGEEASLAPAAWNALLPTLPLPVFGGIFPRIVWGTQTSASGVLLVGLRGEAQICIAEGLSEARPDFCQDDALCAAMRDCATVMIWVDGLARHLSALMESVFDVLGSRPCYVGGGAGSLSFEPRPCLFSNRGLLQDAALIVGLPARMSLGVEHGWESLAGPFIVSEAQGNEVQSLDFRPAAQVYRAALEAQAGVLLTEDNFFALAKDFPFGLERFDGSFLVRDPIRLAGESIVCVGDVPSQSCVHILRSEEAALIRAASTGSSQAVQALAPGLGVVGALVLDCISRALYLEDGYCEELVAVSAVLDAAGQGRAPVFGALTLGEIGNPGNSSLEFFNKTFVLGLMPDANV